MLNIKNIGDRGLRWIKALLFLIALIPCIQLVFGAITYDLGANPIEKITRKTGYWALAFLMITLSATPLRYLSGWLGWIRLRRMLGLFTFFYASLHFLTYLALDQFFDWASIIKDIVKRPYITIGFPSFLLLVPLALTSTDNMIKKLGGKCWRRLHRLVYLAAIGGVAHYWWLVKKDLSDPATFALVLMLLFGIRWYYLEKNFKKSKPVHPLQGKP